MQSPENIEITNKYTSLGGRGRYVGSKENKLMQKFNYKIFTH